MKESRRHRNGERLRYFLGRKSHDEEVRQAMVLITENVEAFGMLMTFVDAQHPSNAMQATYYVDTVLKLVVLTDEELDRFAHCAAKSRGYVRMCRVARALRDTLEREEGDL